MPGLSCLFFRPTTVVYITFRALSCAYPRQIVGLVPGLVPDLSWVISYTKFDKWSLSKRRSDLTLLLKCYVFTSFGSQGERWYAKKILYSIKSKWRKLKFRQWCCGASPDSYNLVSPMMHESAEGWVRHHSTALSLVRSSTRPGLWCFWISRS